MSDEFARQLGLSADELAHLDRLSELMTEPPQAAPDDQPPPVPGRAIVLGCTALILAGIVVMLLAVALAATSTTPRTANPIPPNVNAAY